MTFPVPAVTASGQGGHAVREAHAVLSIEKSRTGKTGIDMEFYKRFDQSRFESDGHIVTEQLVDERVYTE